MRIADAQWIPSTPHQTWDALFDPAVLQRCLPGCIRVSRLTDTEYEITVRAKVGGIDAEYEGEILVSDLNPPKAVPWPLTAKAPPRAWPSAPPRCT